MRVSHLLLAVPILSASLLPCVATVQAQNGSPSASEQRGIEIFGGGRRLNSPTPMKPPSSGNQSTTSKKSDPPTRPALPRTAVQGASVLALQSTSAFERGLLPLNDYLEHLHLINNVELRVASEQQNRRALVSAQQRHVERLEHAANLLEAFQQPAAAGWLAETLLARAMTAEARASLADLRGDRSGAALATRQFQQFSIQHLQAREFDTRELGLGSLPGNAAAVALVGSATQDPRAPGVASALSQQVLLTTEHWNAVGAEIGRADAVLEAEVTSATDRGEWALLSRDKPQFATAVNDAERASREMFDKRLEFYSHGTSSLGDLTNALLLRNRVHQLAASIEGGFTVEMDTRWHDDLQQLVRISQSVEDLRGRNASDVQFVSLLNLIDTTDRSAEQATR
ncbi:MAG TPA: hypothetical protein VNQ76_05490 [Planctomicrobium sp.]|nr:hypothetical protein [Planctomicrobium sp.]